MRRCPGRAAVQERPAKRGPCPGRRVDDQQRTAIEVDRAAIEVDLPDGDVPAIGRPARPVEELRRAVDDPLRSASSVADRELVGDRVSAGGPPLVRAPDAPEIRRSRRLARGSRARRRTATVQTGTRRSLPPAGRAAGSACRRGKVRDGSTSRLAPPSGSGPPQAMGRLVRQSLLALPAPGRRRSRARRRRPRRS